ncbi:non-ribosomal peptide synthetase [Parvularcula marina]|uniref:Amino acid adenylation domain-containing protein n=1 Tax=Parvularcula marina TaxID=2292771 RepID=A0A371RF54_9PROT|nr:non-ribosomal peptide synthetase [Parvularcula marina]RFB04073.1 amino acid adenylation domain-containing protein [Parvularcula marina]
MSHGGKTNIAELIHRLERAGVSFSVPEAERLSLSAPQGVMSPELAAEIRENKPAIVNFLKARLDVQPADTALPLTASQERMWSHGALHPGLPLYVIPAAFEVTGPIDADRLMAAYDRVAAHYDVFRLRIEDQGEETCQRFDGELSGLTLSDLSGAADQDAVLEEEMQHICWSQIELAKEPPVRARLVRLGLSHHWLLMGLHHLAWDGRSFRLFLDALALAYAEPGAVLPPVPNFASFAGAPQPLAQEDLDWWTARLAAPPAPPELSQDRARPALFDHQGAIVPVDIPPALLSRVRAFARSARTTSFTVFLTAFSGFLARIDGSSDRIIGLDSDERSDAYDNAIGNFVNTVLLRDATHKDESFGDAVRRVAAHIPEFLQHPAPVGDVVAATGFLAEPSRPTGAQIMISHQFSENWAPQLGEAKVRRVDLPARTTAAELAFNILEAEEEVTAELQYAVSLFTKAQAAALADAFASFLDAALQAPGDKMSSLSIAPKSMQSAYDRLNDTDVAGPVPTALEGFLEQAGMSPDRSALFFRGETVSYGALAARASLLAAGLAAEGVGPGRIVGIALDRSPDMVASVYAVWMTGAAYLPLDPEHPEQRRQLMIEDSGCELVIGEGEGQLSPDRLAEGQEDASFTPVSADIAYVMYTSGSTGKPKGVVNGHTQVANFLAAMAKRPGCSADDRLLAVTTLGFDISILELFLPLILGGTVILPDAEEAVDGEALVRLAAEHQASIMQGTPATWRLMLDAGWKGDAGLTALCGGEALPASLVKTLLPKVRALWNMYGPTETTVWSTISPITSPDHIPVGMPIDNTQIYIVDPNGTLCPPGLPGELWIGGEGVAKGYHGRDDLTAERFLDDPFSDRLANRVYRTGDRARLSPDGEIIHLGRMDTQLKLRGFRIEAGEIESVLTGHEDIGEAVVIIREQPNGEGALVAYFTATGPFAPTGSELRRWLRQRLPQYMVPQLFVELDALPLTPNGKIDRLSLPAPAGQTSQPREYVAPQSAYEKELAKIWAEILKAENISSTDNFFELGGQSLQAARVAAIFRARTGARIQPRALIFETLAQLAAGAVPEGD